MVRLVASYLRHPNEGVAIASGATMTSAQLAVITFQQHMRGYDQPACEPLLLGDHWAWVSRQYEAMGDLIHRAIDAPSLSKPTLAASPYWQSAALASIKRRRAAEAAGIRHGDGAAVTPTPLAMAARAELARWQILPPKHVGAYPVRCLPTERPVLPTALALHARISQVVGRDSVQQCRRAAA